MAEVVVYGPGGFDPSAPDNNVVEVVTVDDPPADHDRLEVLLDALSVASTLAQVRAAAARAAGA